MHPQPPSALVYDAFLEVAERWLAEQRRARRWAGVWRGLLACYLALFLALYLASSWDSLWIARGPHAALVKISGPIGAKANASAEHAIEALHAAFDNANVKAVLLDIDSPGGSPVQAERIAREIRRLRALHPDTPVVAVIGDTGASAAYYIASSAATIYASRASLVGSIGVRIDSFGFDGAMRTLGVERRLLTAGANKGMLDPFSPLPEGQRAFVQGVLDELHGQFVAAVKQGRGERLKGGDDLFTGLFWSGEQAQALGLVDAIGDTRAALDALGLEQAIDYTPSAFAQVLGQAFGAAIDSAVSGLGWTWR